MMYHSVGAVPSSNATPSSAGCDLVAHYHVQNEWQEVQMWRLVPPHTSCSGSFILAFSVALVRIP